MITGSDSNELKTPNDKSWRLIELEIRPDAEELISSLLFEIGATGIVTLEETDSVLRLGVYFDSSRSLDELSERIKSICADAGEGDALLSLNGSLVDDQDWMQKWKEGFEACEVGERLLVAPSWKVPSNPGNRKVIQIDPGMAFGTGTHETTRLCLEAIEKYWKGGALLDVGTGTGILAIAAALLEPRSRIVAIDVDPVAVEIARQNAAVNGVEIEIQQAQPERLETGVFDIVVANLTAEVIIELMRHLVRAMATNATLILSGILTTLVVDVREALEQAGLSVKEQASAGEWSALVATRTEAR